MSIKEYLRKKYLNEQEERDAWVIQQIDRLGDGCTILDAGAGTQRYKKFCSKLNYVSQDFCQYNGEGDGKGLQTGVFDTSGIDIVGNIWDIPVGDSSFDAILCTEVFEHILYPLETIKEFSRILKPGGILILTAPFCSLTHFAPYHYYTGFTKYWYEQVLFDNGFGIESIETHGNYFRWLLQEMFRLRSVSQKYYKNLNIFNLFSVVFMVGLLNRLSKHSKESEELLCNGYFVVAKRKNVL